MGSTTGTPRSTLAAFLRREWGTILFLITTLCFLAGSFGLRGEAGYFPMGVAVATTVFGLATLLMAFRKLKAGETEVEDGEEGLGLDRRTLLAIAWFAFALAVTYVFGIVIGSAIASTVYFLVLTPVGLVGSLLNGVLFSGFIWIVFNKMASLPLYDGLF